MVLGSAKPIYEIVTGTLKLGKNVEFAKGHQDILVPILKDCGIEPVSMLVTETGTYGKFYNIYRYSALNVYGTQTDGFAKHPKVGDYFNVLTSCVEGSIQVELATELIPHPIVGR